MFRAYAIWLPKFFKRNLKQVKECNSIVNFIGYFSLFCGGTSSFESSVRIVCSCFSKVRGSTRVDMRPKLTNP